VEDVPIDSPHAPESAVIRAARPQAFIPNIVRQHAEEAASLYDRRCALMQMPRVAMRTLDLNDERLSGHLDGLAVAGEHAWAFCVAALERPSSGAVFAAAVRAIEERQPERLDRLLALTEAVPEAQAGLIGAFGWLGRDRLQGIVVKLLGAQEPFRRMVGVAACAAHRVDPGLVTARRIFDSSPLVRSRCLRAAAEVGCLEAEPPCVAATDDEDPDCSYWAAWSGVLLGNRGPALDALMDAGLGTGVHRVSALRLALQAIDVRTAFRALQQLAHDPSQQHWLIQGSGVAGDPSYAAWLIDHMTDARTARLAGEAFSMITGVEFVRDGLEGKEPEAFESGPTEDPIDTNVEMDSDEGLPWPDTRKVQDWWDANKHRFYPGTRYFMGQPVTREHCIHVLKTGYQRQRILAAHYLCLLDPGTPLFNTSAPAWRQQRLLAQM
jgi:uncharacterized protein (TIGR02270 family)